MLLVGVGGLATLGLLVAQAPPAPQAPAVPPPETQAPETQAPALAVAPAENPAPVATGVAAPATSGANAAVNLLVEQGQRWLSEGHPDLAMSSAQRALSAEPNNVAALLLAARASVARGDRMAASGYVDRLHGAGATPEQQARGNAILQEATIDPAALAEARQLAREGHMDEAAARYQSLFGAGGPPAGYAREYYQVLAAAAGTRALGQQGLARLAAARDASDATLLAYAQSLTYAAATRADGINRLAGLTERADVAAQAQAAWRQALGFYGNDPAVLPLMDAYLRRFPGDAEILRQHQAVRTTAPAPPTEAQLAAQAGYAAINRGALAAAEKQFEAILATHPNDPDALAGLGIDRLRENRPADAKELLQRAIAAAPERAAEWKKALDAANYPLELANARTLLRRRDLAEAEAVLHQALSRDVEDKTDAESLLGDVAMRRGDAAEAEQNYRAALATRPGFAPAVAGLNQALRAEGRGAEVIAEPRVTAPVRARPVYQGGGTVLARGVLSGARAQAAATADPSVQVAILTRAMNATPNDPWVRHDLAEALRRLGRGAEGQAIMEELVARQPTPDALYAAALLAHDDGRTADAQALMARIPVRRLTPDMARFQAGLQQQQDVAYAAGLLSSEPFVARQRLMILAARPDPTGGTAAAVIRALGNAGDLATAAQAAQTAEMANPWADARIAIAGALQQVGLDSYASALIARLDTSGLTPSQRRNIALVQTEANIRASDRLNERGDQAAAFERLRPSLLNDPFNPDVQLALARLYQGAGRPADAMRIAAAVLTRDPRNMQARQAAVEAAIAAGDRRQASVIANEAAAIAPGDAQTLLLQARVARAFGNFPNARALLSQAAARRQEELGAAPGTGAFPAGPTALPNPFRSSENATPTPRVASQDDPTGPAAADPTVRTAEADQPGQPAADPPSQAEADPPGVTAADPTVRTAEADPPAQPAAEPPGQTGADPPGAMVADPPVRTAEADPAAQPAADPPYQPVAYQPNPAVLQNPFGSPGTGPETPLPADPIARQIAEEQAALREETASHVSGGVNVDARSGTAGLDKLVNISAPLEASVVPDWIGGRLGATVTPVVLDSGTLSGSANILRFGSNAGTGRSALPTASTATGVGLGVYYHRGSLLSADVGASPLGFPVSTIVGGIEIAPKLSNDVTLRLRGERRMVTDSLLSYAGERDPVTGTTWGGVTRNGGHAQLEYGLGGGGYVYGGGGYNVLAGEHVADNNEVEAGAGFGYPIYKDQDSTLISGLDLIYFRYANNQRGFTVGQGGYFSPQNFASIQIPLDYRSTWGRLQYHLRGALGYDTFREDGSPLYPLDPQLQAAADAAALGNPDIPTHNIAQNKSGVVGGIRVDLRYPLTDVLTLAGGFAFNEAPQWQQGSVYIKLDGQF
jgi:Tfp pilus assembly protein PilF